MVLKFKDSRDFVYLSDVYVYTEQFGKKGHQMGRKVGDMLEILTMGYCLFKENLKKAMRTEIALEGFTGAKHKVEFSFYDSNEEKNKLIGFIECKKVGVEVTVHSKTRDSSLQIPVGNSFTHNISPTID